MRERQLDTPDSHAVRILARDAAKPECRPSGLLIYDIEILPPHAVAPTGSNCLHSRLLSGEAGRQAFHRVGLTGRISPLARGVNAVQKTISEPRYARTDALYFRQVCPNTKDHKFQSLAAR